MAEYQLLNDTTTVLRTADGAYIPDDPANIDRQTYDQWLADGGVPDPAPPLPDPPPPQPVELPAHPVDEMDAATKGYVDTAIAAAIAPLQGRT